MRNRFSLLDPLRLLAALAVVLFHYAYRGAAADGLTHLSIPDWRPVAQYGYLGVQLFFVISGFVIAMSAQGRSMGGFVIARFTRIYPGFVTCMTLSFVVMLLFGAPVFSTSPKQWAANLIIVSPALHQPFMDGAYWSIVYEIIFYGWVTLLLFKNTFFKYLNIVVLCWVGISALNEIAGPSMLVRHLFLTDVSGFFIAGIMIHDLRTTRASLRTWVILALGMELAAGQAIIVSRYNVAHYGADLSKLVIVAISIASIGLVGLCTSVRVSIRPTSALIALGGLTYPLYLLHQNIGFIIFNLLGSRVPPRALLLTTMLLLMVVSLMVFYTVERPAQAWLKRVFAGLKSFKPVDGRNQAS